MAYLYIDDGYLFRYCTRVYKERDKGKNMFLHLQDFPPIDVQRFCDYINNKYNWHWKLNRPQKKAPHKAGPIVIPSDDRREFFQLINPYLLSHWHYKVNKESRFDPTINPPRCKEGQSDKIIYPSTTAKEKWGWE